ncbi:DUF5053 domain-containing protein [Barnesiella propionica]|uniref:DUF5053 domain-containing protein n=1 Tax=Barnesiella propionica TaxID=2981781 RepID=UPI0011C77C0C|nr:DUF5053 domain-containing protein [Barnesiella propionica]MCU6769800.1 DUF5053 domain-containing protein [Barnesiella propionica]
MNLQAELEKLNQYYFDTDQEKFQKQYLYVCEKYPNDKEQIDNYLAKIIDNSIERVDDFIEATKVKMQLMEVTEIVSLSYIAKNYFHKTRTWLYQKINGNKVNGKEASFTKEEINTLNYAIQDISKKLGSTVISL